MHQHGDQRIAVVVVDRILRLPGDDLACIHVTDGAADQLVTIGCLRRWWIVWQGDLAGVASETAIAEATTVRCDDRARIAAQPIGRHAEPTGGSLQKGRADDLLSNDADRDSEGFVGEEAGELQTALGGIGSLSTGNAGSRQSDEDNKASR